MSGPISQSLVRSVARAIRPTMPSSIGRYLMAAACAMGGLTQLISAPDAAAQFFGSSQDRKAGIAQDDAARMLSIAMSYMSEGKLLMARSQLEILIERYPSSSAADEARRALAPIRAAGTHRGDPDSKPGSASDDEPRSSAPIAGPSTPRAIVPANVRALEARFRETTGDRVFFPATSAELGTKARSVLSAQAAWLKAHPQVQVVIEAHADEPGSAELNHEIAAQRGEAVRARLVEEGLPADRVQVVVRGRDSPVANCSDSSCSAQNRRVVTRIEPGSQRVGTAGSAGSVSSAGTRPAAFDADRRN